MRDLQEAPDREWDEKLGIITAGAGADSKDTVNFRYEPTPYAVLARLAESGLIGPDSVLIDYGCGRGRCPLFLHAKTGCRAIGIDHNPVLVGEAKANLERMKAGKARKQAVTFRRMRAQDYRVKEEDCFYFFNPFSEVILQAVLQEIIASWYENPRQVYLFFYYPKDEDVALLSMYDEIFFYDEIDCTDLYGGQDKRERVLIYELSAED